MTQGPRGRRFAPAAVLLAALAGPACEERPAQGALVLEPGRVVATYPGPDEGERPALGHLSALAVADGELWLVDQIGGRVHRFAVDGTHLGSVGRKGEGPGELQRPTEVEVGPGGDVWVADPEAGRVTRFGPGGGMRSVRRAPYGGTDFGLLPEGRIVVPSPTEGRVLAVVAPGDEITELAPGPETPDALSSLTPADRFGFMATFLETDPSTGAVYFLVNRDEYALWRLRVRERQGRIVDARRVAMPGWLDDAIAAALRRQQEGLEQAGMEFVPFNDLHLTGTHLWLTTGPLGVLGVAVPVPGDEGRPVVVRPPDGAGEGRGEGRFRGLRHAALTPEGLYAVYPAQARLFALDTVGVRPTPDLR